MQTTQGLIQYLYQFENEDKEHLKNRVQLARCMYETFAIILNIDIFSGSRDWIRSSQAWHAFLQRLRENCCGSISPRRIQSEHNSTEPLGSLLFDRNYTGVLTGRLRANSFRRICR
jgi:hypothetical protein